MSVIRPKSKYMYSQQPVIGKVKIVEIKTVIALTNIRDGNKL